MIMKRRESRPSRVCDGPASPSSTSTRTVPRAWAGGVAAGVVTLWLAGAGLAAQPGSPASAPMADGRVAAVALVSPLPAGGGSDGAGSDDEGAGGGGSGLMPKPKPKPVGDGAGSAGSKKSGGHGKGHAGKDSDTESESGGIFGWIKRLVEGITKAAGSGVSAALGHSSGGK
jgi:hypothetical protein